MKRFALLFVTFAIVACLQAQVGFNNPNPHPHVGARLQRVQLLIFICNLFAHSLILGQVWEAQVKGCDFYVA
ncbi:MAG: hypothetical protein ACKVOQ_01485 [Cyclobacteriaceae bacterium]